MKKYYSIMLVLLAFACAPPVDNKVNKQLADQISKNEYFPI
jgi:hypothetical protein